MPIDLNPYMLYYPRNYGPGYSRHPYARPTAEQGHTLQPRYVRPPPNQPPQSGSLPGIRDRTYGLPYMRRPRPGYYGPGY
jgi:hypothetical protein